MRALLALLGLAALVLIALIMLGFISFDQTRPLVVQAPEFKADVGKVNLTTENRSVAVPTVQTEEKTIAVPTLEVQRPANAQAPAQ